MKEPVVRKKGKCKSAAEVKKKQTKEEGKKKKTRRKGWPNSLEKGSTNKQSRNKPTPVGEERRSSRKGGEKQNPQFNGGRGEITLKHPAKAGRRSLGS